MIMRKEKFPKSSYAQRKASTINNPKQRINDICKAIVTRYSDAAKDEVKYIYVFINKDLRSTSNITFMIMTKHIFREEEMMMMIKKCNFYDNIEKIYTNLYGMSILGFETRIAGRKLSFPRSAFLHVHLSDVLTRERAAAK